MTREQLILALIVLGLVTPLLGLRMPSHLRANGERAVALFAMLTALGLVAYSHRHQQPLPHAPAPTRSGRWEFQPVDDGAARRLLARAAPLPALGQVPGYAAPGVWTPHEQSGAVECQTGYSFVATEYGRTYDHRLADALGCLGPIAYQRHLDPTSVEREDDPGPQSLRITGPAGISFSCDPTAFSSPEVAVDTTTNTYAIRCSSTGPHIVLRETLVERLDPAPPEEARAWRAAVTRIRATHLAYARAERLALLGVVLALAAWLSSLGLRRTLPNAPERKPASAPYRTAQREESPVLQEPFEHALRVSMARRALAATALVIGFSAPLVGVLVVPPAAVAYTHATRQTTTPLRAVCLNRSDVPVSENAPVQRPLYLDRAMRPHCERSGAH